MEKFHVHLISPELKICAEPSITFQNTLTIPMRDPILGVQLVPHSDFIFVKRTNCTRHHNFLDIIIILNCTYIRRCLSIHLYLFDVNAKLCYGNEMDEV